MVMTIPANIAQLFSAESRAEGERYLFEGRVIDFHSDENSADACVSLDTDELFVDLAIKGNVLGIECDCIHFMNSGFCGHAWAVVLMCLQEGVFPEHRWMGITGIVNLYDDEDDDEAIYDSFDTLCQNQIYYDTSSFSGWKTIFTNSSMEACDSRSMKDHERLFYYLKPFSRYSNDLGVSVMKRYRKKNSEWSVPKPLPSQFDFNDVADETDRKIIALLNQDLYHFYSHNIKLNEVQAKMLLPMMADTGRCFISEENGNELGPVTFSNTLYRLQCTLSESKNGKYTLLCSVFRDGTNKVQEKSIRTIWNSGIIFLEKEIAVVEGSRNILNTLLQIYLKGPYTIDGHDIDDFLNRHFSDHRQLPISLPESLNIEEIKIKPVPCLQLLKPKPGERVNGYLGHLQFDYDGHTVDHDTNEKTIYNADRRKVYILDQTFHQDMTLRLKNESIPIHNSHFRKFKVAKISAKKLLPLAAHLLGEGWRIEGEQMEYKIPGAISLNVSSGIDWFELKGTCTYDDTIVPLPEILAAAKKKKNFITLSDGSFGLLPQDWLKKYATLTAMGKSGATSLRFTRAQTFLVDALLADQEDENSITCDETFDKIRSEISSFSGIGPMEPPQQFRGNLRPYQKEGLGWFAFLRKFGLGGCLADDMGLGKTVQVLAQLQKLKYENDGNDTAHPSLVVAPRSLIFNWKEEAYRFTPDLSVLDFSNIKRKDTLPDFTRFDIVLVTYGTLRRDIARLRYTRFRYVILDEAQVIKNPGTLTAKTARLLNADHRLALSGTPVENHISDLWSIFEFLNPGMLGNATVLSTLKSENTGTPEIYELLRRILKPFILRRTKAQVATDLPARTEDRIICEMDPQQRKMYNELKKYYQSRLLKKVSEDGINRSKIMILEALLRLRQAACHPCLVNGEITAESIGSVKLDTLLAQIVELLQEGSKCLVFSQFTKMLAMIRRKLDDAKIAYEYLDGKTKDRKSCVERFQNNPDCGVFLISLKAGGTGLNLTSAEYVFIFDPWWNPAVEAQAIDRTHRIGQDKPVFAYRLICKDTVEEKVLELQDKKRDLAEKVISDDESLLRSISTEELQLLFM